MTTAPVRITPPEDGPKLEVPCAGCVKADVCAIRPTLDVAELVGTGLERHPAIHLRVVVVCDAFLAAASRPKPREAATAAKPPRSAAASPFAVPRPDTAQRSQEPAVLERRSATDKRAAEIAAVVDRHGGDRRAAAAELKMRPQALGRILTSYLERVAAAVPA